uniref:Uncharacterized protein n=1 Tax=Anguilla anguilla TaxID=7936 RepID=A0A0E9TLU6_ANGAN
MRFPKLTLLVNLVYPGRQSLSSI